MVQTNGCCKGKKKEIRQAKAMTTNVLYFCTTWLCVTFCPVLVLLFYIL